MCWPDTTRQNPARSWPDPTQVTQPDPQVHPTRGQLRDKEPWEFIVRIKNNFQQIFHSFRQFLISGPIWQPL